MEEKDPLQKIEEILQNPSSVTNKQSFVTWDELQNRTPRFEFHPKSKSTGVLVRFPTKKLIWSGSALFAAASILVVFMIQKPTSLENISKEEVSVTSPTNLIKNPLGGKVIHTKGDVMIIPDQGKDPVRLEKGYQLAAGDQIFTGKSGQVDLDFENQSWVRLNRLTKVRIIELFTNEMFDDQKLELIEGKVFAQVPKLTKTNNFSVLSGGRETLVRGTSFSVSYINGQNTVAVREGAVAVLETVVSANQQIRFEKEKPETASVQPIGDKEGKELKAFQTQISLARESSLYNEYSRLELVRLENGTEYRGVILGQSETHLKFLHSSGPMEIPISEILETEKIR